MDVLLRILFGVVLFILTESSSINQPEGTGNDQIPVKVTQHTTVTRFRRSLADIDPGFDVFDFPDEMMFTVHVRNKDVDLYLRKDAYFKTDIKITGIENMDDYHFEDRFNMYQSADPSAAILVECQIDGCLMQGTVDVDGELYTVTPDHDSMDLSEHFMKKKTLDDLKTLKDVMYTARPDEYPQTGTTRSRHKRSEDMYIAEIEKKAHHRSRRAFGQNATEDLANCEIIEAKAIVDNTIWEEYLNRYNDSTTATEEIYRYYTAIFGEVNLRMGNIDTALREVNCTDMTCLRTILVEIQIDQASSWTDGYLFSDGVQTFVRGFEALQNCGNINQNSADNYRWDMLFCFTRRNIAVQPPGQSAYYDRYRSYTWQPFFCLDRFYSVSIQESLGDGVDQQILRNMLHGLNAQRSEVNTCEDEGSVMTRIFGDRPDIPTWFLSYFASSCTANEICSYVRGLNTGNNNCLRFNNFTEADWLAYYNTTSVLPGTIYTADQQCQEKFGPNSTQCDPEGNGNLFPEFMCSRYIHCNVNGQCNCLCRVLSGTSCGFARVCLNGLCVPIPNQPNGADCDCHSQCGTANAVCGENRTCECASGYFDSNGDEPGGICEPSTTVIECEDGTLQISCNAGETILIISANYGRTADGSVCPHPSIQTTNCISANSLSIVSTACNGQQTCQVGANNGVFGEPCSGTYKYLEVEYTCQ